MDNLDLPRIIKPGQRVRGVRLAKRICHSKLSKTRHKWMTNSLNLDSPRYGRGAVRCIKQIQRMHGLKADGIIGPKTWSALGQYRNMAPRQLRGITWPGPAFRSWNGCWIPWKLFNALVYAKKRKGWGGVPYSVHRPDWYQKILWDAAVKKYGIAEAGKWVAPPGRSNHRHRDARCAVDATYATQLRRVDKRWYQPMSWEEWHCQWKAAYGIRALSAAVDSIRSLVASDSDLKVPRDIDYAVLEEEVVEFLGKIDAAILEQRGE